MFDIFERKLAAYQGLSTGWLKVYINVVLPLLSGFLTWKFVSSHLLSASSGWVDYGFSLAACLLAWACTVLSHYLDRITLVLNMALMLVGVAWVFMPVFSKPHEAAMAEMMPPAPLPLGLTSQSISLLAAILLLIVLYFQTIYFLRRRALFTLPDNVRSNEDWDDDDEF